MNPLAWALPAAANATRPNPNVAIGYRPDAGSAMRRKVQRAQVSDGQSDRGAGEQLVHQVGDRALRVEHEGHHAEHQHEDDGGRVVESGLGLEQSGNPPGQRQHAQNREHRCRVGGGHDGSEQQRDLPVHAWSSRCAPTAVTTMLMTTPTWPTRPRAPAPCGCRRTGWSNRLRRGSRPALRCPRSWRVRRRRTPDRGRPRRGRHRPEGRRAGWGTPRASPPACRQCWPAARSHRSAKPGTAGASSFRSRSDRTSAAVRVWPVNQYQPG